MVCISLFNELNSYSYDNSLLSLFFLELFPKIAPDSIAKSTLLFKFGGDSSIASINGHHWKKQRKIANPAFHRSMPVHMFGKLTQDLFHEMDKMGPVLEVTDLMERCTLDAIGKAGFGKSHLLDPFITSFLSLTFVLLNLDFDFNAIKDKDNTWVTTYNSFNEALFQPIYFLFPILESHFLWMLPQRKKAHDNVDRFLSMMRNIIVEKRSKIKNNQNQNSNLNENEKDLLTLMIESEMKGEGQMTNKELEVNIYLHLCICIYMFIFIYFDKI
jgi:cholesterol 24(S)-hydroxylase